MGGNRKGLIMVIVIIVGFLGLLTYATLNSSIPGPQDGAPSIQEKERP